MSRSAFLAVALAFALSGCIVQEQSPDDAEEIVAIEAPITEPLIETLSGNTGTAVSTPALSVTNGGTYEFPLDVTTANITGYILEVHWDAADASTQQLDLWIRRTGDFAIPPSDPMTFVNNQPQHKVTGANPLRMALTPDMLDAGTPYSILVRAATPAGIAVGQPFELNVATFAGLPFDDAYDGFHAHE